MRVFCYVCVVLHTSTPFRSLYLRYNSQYSSSVVYSYEVLIYFHYMQNTQNGLCTLVQHLRLTTAGYGGYYTLHTTQRAGVESGGQACTRHTRVACDHKLRVTASGILHRKQHRNYEGIIEVRCVPCLRNYQRTSHTAAVKLTYNLQVNNVR